MAAELTFRSHLILRVIVLLQVRVRQRFFHGDSLLGIECEQLFQQIQCLEISFGVQLGPGYFGLEG